MTTHAFVETRIANRKHYCTQCGTPISDGNEYIREAIPPWAYRDYDEDGNVIDYGDGTWLVIKKCDYCMWGRYE